MTSTGIFAPFITLLVCLLLGLFTSSLIESPFRYSMRHLGQVGGIYSIVLMLLLAASHGTIRAKSNPQSPRMTGRQFSPVKNNFSLTAILGLSSPTTVDEDLLLKGRRIAGTGKSRILLLGDSHGLSWAPTLRDRLASEYSTLTVWCVDRVSPFIPNNKDTHQQVQFLSAKQKTLFDEAKRTAITNHEYDVIIVVSRWSLGDSKLVSDNIDLYCQYAKRIVVLGEFPPITWFADWSLVGIGKLPITVLENGNMVTSKYDNPASQTAMDSCSKSSRCVFIDSARYLGWPEQIVVGAAMKSFYYDNNHPSDIGVQYVVSQSLEVMRKHIRLDKVD